MRGLRSWFAAWRVTPRRTLLRWDLRRGYLFPPYVVAMGAIGAWRLLAVDAPRFSGTARLAAVAGGLAFLAAGTLAAFVIVVYLRRPVINDPPVKAEPVSADETARAESERRAWRSR